MNKRETFNYPRIPKGYKIITTFHFEKVLHVIIATKGKKRPKLSDLLFWEGELTPRYIINIIG